jgi:FecR-like protein/WD40 domain-containing protein
MRPDEKEALADLFSRHLDGLLDEPQEKKLADLLAASAEARAVASSFMRLEGSLALRREVNGVAAPVAAPRRWRWAAAAAACLAVSAGVAWLVSASGRPEMVRLERVEGRVEIAGEERRAGDSLLSGQGVDVIGPKSRASLRFRDGTLLELAPETRLERIEDARNGKRVKMTRGSLQAKVTPQPKEEPMVFESPHGEARVVGTTLRILVDQSPKLGMRLEVEEGKVNLRRLADSRTVLVETGHYAVVATGIELAVRPLAPRVTMASRGTFRTSVKGIAGATLSPDAKLLALGGADGTVAVVDAVTGAERIVLGRHADAVQWLAFAPDSGTLASADRQRRVVLWTLPRGERRAEFSVPQLSNGWGLQAMAFSPDGSVLATRNTTEVLLWNGATGLPLPTTLKYPEAEALVHCIAFSSDGRLVSAGRQGRVTLWDVAAGRKTAEFPLAVSQTVWAVFSPDGKRLAAGGGWGGVPPLMKFWDLVKGVEEPVDFPATPGDVSVTTAAFSPDGKTLVRLDGDGAVRLWDIAARIELTRLSTRAGFIHVGFVQGGTAIQLVNQDGAIELWSLDRDNR